ncbi:hypothetical protein JCM5350_001800 [Sporobolomyces pararoseus]
MIGTLAGWASLGFGVRCYQLAIMKRNIFENLGGHVLSAGAFAGVGYWAMNADARNRELIQEKKEQLLRMREKDAPLGEESAEHH